MLPLVIILIPLLFAAIAAAVGSNRLRPWLLPPAAIAHFTLTLLAIAQTRDAIAGFTVPVTSGVTSVGLASGGDALLALDPPGRIILLLISSLFLFCSFYTVGYLRHRPERPNRVFVACLLSLLGTMTFVIFARHMGLLWVAVESSSLVTAPLIYFNRTQRSIEATWKYLLVCSVGIALALLGTFFLAYSSLHAGLEPTLLIDSLLIQAPQLSKHWLHAAFILLLIGYGTKMGLAPMHTWKPDAYGEAPGVVGAVLAGGVTSCAFLAILRVNHICAAAGESPFTSRLLLFMGLFSMAVAGLFMVGQRDFKRMLAYSSVEHMGILILGLAIGSRLAIFGTMLHLLANGLTKGVLFLSAGNIHRAYNSKSIDDVRGAIRRLPLSGSLFLVAFLAITGSPPFGPFISEFSILNAAFDTHHFLTASLFLLFLLVVFIGMGATVLHVVQGRPPAQARSWPSSALAGIPQVPQASLPGALPGAGAYRDGFLTASPILILLALVLMLGLRIPAPLMTLLNDAVNYLEVHP
ncbi:MAG: proton-conducting transporter membrane subunit [Phycisphaeraceae bacterium]